MNNNLFSFVHQETENFQLFFQSLTKVLFLRRLKNKYSIIYADVNRLSSSLQICFIRRRADMMEVGSPPPGSTHCPHM